MAKKIKFIANTWIFGAAPIEKVIPKIAEIGYDGIELIGEPQLFNAKELKKILDDNGIYAHSTAGFHPGIDPNDLRALGHPDEKERQRAIDYIYACIDLVAELGGRSVLIVPSLVGNPKYFVSKEEDAKLATESLAKAAPYAEKNRILITLEPINRYEVNILNSVKDAIAMAKEINSPWVRIMGDTYHMQLEEGDGIPNAIRRAGKYWLQHMHAADNTREAPGKGTMPWKEIIRALHDIDYEGVISLEPLPKVATPYEARSGNLPIDSLSSELKFGLTFLHTLQEVVLGYLT